MGGFKDETRVIGLTTISIVRSWAVNSRPPQVDGAAEGVSGTGNYGSDAYCKDAVMDRRGSDILNR